MIGLITDTHLSKQNIHVVRNVIKDVIQICIDNNITTLFHLGDWFNQRNAQPLELMIETIELFSSISDAGINLIIIPGNHDKTDLNSSKSYLHLYSDIVTVVDEYQRFDIDDIIYDCIPYFENEKYIDILNSISKSNKQQILLTHIAINGVLNNDLSTVENGIEKNQFNKFHAVFVGHYHNKSILSKKITYIGSAYQANYGETDDKGLSIYDGESLSVINLDFPKFFKHKIKVKDINSSKLKEITELVSLGHRVRLDIEGTIEQTKSFDLSILRDAGIDYKLVSDAIERKEIVSILKKFNDSTILKEFESFCIEKKLDHKEGLELLKQVINVGN